MLLTGPENEFASRMMSGVAAVRSKSLFYWPVITNVSGSPQRREREGADEENLAEAVKVVKFRPGDGNIEDIENNYKQSVSLRRSEPGYLRGTIRHWQNMTKMI